MLGRVTLGRDKARVIGNRAQSGTTLRTVFGCGRNLSPTDGTSTSQRRSALFAELRLNGVLVVAAWAFHYTPLKSQASQMRSVTSPIVGNKAYVLVGVWAHGRRPGGAPTGGSIQGARGEMAVAWPRVPCTRFEREDIDNCS